MVKYSTLQQQNHCLDLESIKDLQALYEGGKSLEKRLNNINPPNQNEDHELREKKTRIALDSYWNYFQQIVSFYPGSLFAYPLEIRSTKPQMPEFYKEFSENCNVIGTDFVDYERQALTCALVQGRHVTEIVIPDSEATNKEEWELTGAGDLYLQQWEACDVLDWLNDEAGALEWIKLYDCKHVRSGPLASEMIQYTWVIIDKEAKYTYEVLAEKGAYLQNDTDIPLVKTQVHNLGFVPVVDLYLPPGLHLGRHLRAPIVSNLRGRAAYWWSISKQAYSVPVIKTSADMSNLKATGAIQIPIDSEFSWSNPPSEFLKNLSDWCESSMQEAYRVGSRLSYNTASSSSYSLVRSAASRVEDRSSDQVTMKVFGACVREHAKTILDMISKIRQDDIVWSINGFEHLEHLQLPDIAAIAKTLSEVNFPAISAVSETYAKELKKRILDLTFQDADETIKEIIRKEIDTAKELDVVPAIEPKTIPAGEPEEIEDAEDE